MRSTDNQPHVNDSYHQGGAWPLHDDFGIVTDTALEEQLELVSASAVSPAAGIFGPASMTWRMNREAILFLAAARALLLQLAHPWIAAAVDDHSGGLTDPIARFHRTFKVVFTMVFGSVDQAFAAARGLHRRHSVIRGVLPEAVGPFKAGSPYCANNISALRWVYATLSDSALVAHDLVLGTLGEAERARLYSESRLFAGMFGIPANLLPANYTGLTTYIQAMHDSDILTVSAAARHVAGQLFASGGVRVRVPKTYLALTSGMLPERLRRDFGLSYAEADRRRGERALNWIRRAYQRLPVRLRYVGPYHEAQQRLAGRPNPDIFTRLANRLWIGQPDLGG
jgi:uncharacterized protein (DUF2236 family)